MADLLAAGSAWLAGMQKRNASISVKLRRRGYADVVVSATAGTTRVEQDTGDNSTMRFESRDYLISVDDYRFGGVKSTPRDHDRIVEVRDGVEVVYEAFPFAGEACARWMDQSGVRWRIHTKLVEAAPQLLTENQLRTILDLLPVIGDSFEENEMRHTLGIVSLAA
jgi:hypothetical protein